MRSNDHRSIALGINGTAQIDENGCILTMDGEFCHDEPHLHICVTIIKYLKKKFCMRLRFCGQMRCGRSCGCGCGQRSNRRCLEKTGFIRKNLENTELVAFIHVNFIYYIKKIFQFECVYMFSMFQFIFIFPNKLEQCFLKFARGKGWREGRGYLY